MKRLLLAALLIALLGGGLAWTLRRQPSAAPLDDPGQGFTVETRGAGRLVSFQDPQTPLRALRWLPPLAGGVLAAQELGQNDRQRVALFRDGQSPATLLVLKPLGVSEGFWRFATLRDALQAPGGTLLLLYLAGDPASPEPPLLVALDPASQQVRWSFRGAGDRLALTGAGEAIYLYGGKAPIQRLTLAPAGPAAPGGPHPAPTSIDLPPGIQAVEGFLPTGSSSFLVSHPDGLSAYQPAGGWTHFPAPEERGVPCQDWRSTLAQAGKTIWWQAVPGRMLRVRPDGRPLTPWSEALPPEDACARDAQLLRLLGPDPAGALWFALAVPAPAPVPPPVPAAEGAPGPDAAAAPAPGPGEGDWAGYAAAQGLDRIYRWDPTGRKLERVSLIKAWAALNPPLALPPPAPAQALAPAAGALLAEGNRSAWWLPLAALPLTPVATTRP